VGAGRRDGLKKNLEQEKAALSKMQTIGKRLAKDGAKTAA
jgi:hypothetical protein